MGQLTFTRREALIAGAGTALAGGVLSASSATPVLNLEDPAVRARVRAESVGVGRRGKSLQVLPLAHLRLYA